MHTISWQGSVIRISCQQTSALHRAGNKQHF